MKIKAPKWGFLVAGAGFDPPPGGYEPNAKFFLK
jgi:hypothetical protein